MSNQIEILDSSVTKDDTNYSYYSSPGLNTTNLMEEFESGNIEKDTFRLDLLNDKIFNTNHQIKNPRKIANIFTYLYFNGDPLITIGPHCNK